MSSRMSRLMPASLFSVALAVACLLNGPALAQPRDILDDAKQRQQVELQRVEADFTQVKDKARKLSVAEPNQAIAMLSAYRDQIAVNTDIPETNRDAILRNINNLLAGYRARAIDMASSPTTKPPVRIDDKKKPEDDARNVYDTGKNERQRVLNVKVQDDYIKKAREEGWVAVQMSNERAQIMQAEDIRFPENWKDLSAKRLQVNMTEKERKLLKALATPMDIDLQDSTLEDVLKYLQDKSGVPIIVPQAVLDDKAITYKVPVSITLKGVTMRTILKKVLGDVGLVYIIDKEVIQATTEERARSVLTTRTYPVGDLFGYQAQRFGGIQRSPQMVLAVNDIINVIVGTVEPNSWWVNGGQGTIAFDPRSMSLVVRQTAEVHSMIFMGAGR